MLGSQAPPALRWSDVVAPSRVLCRGWEAAGVRSASAAQLGCVGAASGHSTDGALCLLFLQRREKAAYLLASPGKTPAAINAGSIRMSIACSKNSPRIRQRSKLDGTLSRLDLDFEQEKKAPRLAPRGAGGLPATKGAKGGSNPLFFIFDPKTQKPNSAVRPSVKSRRRLPKPGNQLSSGKP